MTKRLTVRVSDEVYERVTEWAKKLGVTQSQLGGMAVHSGIDSLIRAVSPADALTSQQWGVILKAMEMQGISFDGVKIGSEELPGGENEVSNKHSQ